MVGFEEKFNYAGTEKRYEKWEKEPIPVVNTLKEFGIPSLQHEDRTELNPKEIVDVDDRALRNPECPNIVFGRPHAGEFVPKDIWERATEKGRKGFAVIDKGTEIIFKSEDIPSVGTKISRFVVDPNRGPLLEMNPKNPLTPGKVTWHKNLFGENIYREDKIPNQEEIKDLVERIYLPYYNGMMGVIGSITDRRKEKNERILVIDGHSFPTGKVWKPLYEKYDIEKPEDLPMFIIGDFDGQTCDEDITKAFVVALKKNFEDLNEEIRKDLTKDIHGELVGFNKPFKGVQNVQFYGQRNEGVNSFQLECNERAYTEVTGEDSLNFEYKNENLKIVKKLIEKTCQDINSILKK